MKARRLIKVLIATSAFLGGGAANAGEVWSDYRTITSLYPRHNGFGFFLSGPAIGTGPCETNRFVLLEAQGGVGYDGLVSTITTAFTAGYLIRVAYEQTTVSDCDVKVYRVIVRKP